MGNFINEADLKNPVFYCNLYMCSKKKIQNNNIFRPTYPNFFDLRYLNTTIFFFWPDITITY